MFCVREVQKHCVLQNFVGVEKQQFRGGEMVTKCKNRGFSKGGVGNARRADMHNRHFFGDGPVSTTLAKMLPKMILQIPNMST